MPVGQDKFRVPDALCQRCWSGYKDAEKVKQGVDLLIKFKEAIPQAYRGQTDPYL